MFSYSMSVIFRKPTSCRLFLFWFWFGILFCFSFLSLLRGRRFIFTFILITLLIALLILIILVLVIILITFVIIYTERMKTWEVGSSYIELHIHNVLHLSGLELKKQKRTEDKYSSTLFFFFFFFAILQYKGQHLHTHLNHPLCGDWLGMDFKDSTYTWC